MKVLVLIRSADDLRDYESTLRLLADRGHDVHVITDPPAVPFNALSFFGLELRRRIDRLQDGGRKSRLAARLVGGCERTLPRDERTDDFIRAHDPDVVLTSAIDPGSSHEEYVRSAHAHGIPVRGKPQTTEDIASLEGEAVGRRRAHTHAPWWGPLARPILSRAAYRLARTDEARAQKAVRQARLKEQRDAALVAQRAEAAVTRRQAEAERARREQEEAAQLAEERRAREASAARAYERYESVREWALRMRRLSPGANDDTLAHLWAASPETIASLRQYCEPLGGARVGDYQQPDSELATRLRQAIVALRRWVGSDLFVPEPSTLGGFGYLVRRDLCNEDTLRFFRVLVALQDGAILGDLQGATTRRLVWEIGGGWGGFAYQFKTVCPNVTYLITGLPEQLLASATYLQATFPDARCRFFEDSPADDVWRDWEQVDFVFAPEAALTTLRPPRLDVTLDVLTMRTMTPARVCAHVQHAFDCGSRYFYSLLPGASAGDVAARLSNCLERLYWIHPVPARTEADSGSTAIAAPASDIDYAHAIGWRRIRV